jgi:WD40 repeat protein
LKNRNQIECICNGHSEGELWSLAMSPVSSDVFATASDDHTVRIWNMKNKSLQKVTELDKKVRSCAFNSDGSFSFLNNSSQLIAVLDASGNLSVKGNVTAYAAI